MLTDGLESCGLLRCFISCLDSHSDGTHSLQRIHCWASDAMLHFPKPDEETNSSTSWMIWRWGHFQLIQMYRWTTPVTVMHGILWLTRLTSFSTPFLLNTNNYAAWHPEQNPRSSSAYSSAKHAVIKVSFTPGQCSWRHTCFTGRTWTITCRWNTPPTASHAHKAEENSVLLV